MNIYVVVEGNVSEQIIYRNWIPHINSDLSQIKNVDEFDNNNFIIYSGGGYPNYLEVIQNAIRDINELGKVDRLVICVDAEDDTYEDKYNEIDSFVQDNPCSADVRIVVQYFCFETWGLGNKRVFPSHNLGSTLQDYKNFYNVHSDDPENLPPYGDMNRATFAVKYLKKILNKKFKGGTYTKSNPKFLMKTKFYDQILERHNSTGHIQRFANLVDAFS